MVIKPTNLMVLEKNMILIKKRIAAISSKKMVNELFILDLINMKG